MTMRQMIALADFADHFIPLDGLGDDGYVTTITRGRLATTGVDTPQPRLWSEHVDCNILTQVPSNGVLDYRDRNLLCDLNGGYSTFGNFSSLENPYFSQLPSGFPTGLVRQFAPRINSTALRENITADQFGKERVKTPDSLYIHYQNTTAEENYNYSWSLDACMPSNQSVSPWKASHERQDFTEDLYLRISLGGFEDDGIPSGVYYSKITLDTTAGFFELPNYMNGGVPGPLLEDNPNNHCKTDCAEQGDGDSLIHNPTITRHGWMDG
ncbi:hypothetical protein F4782DRAFT_547998 [Xylaria castorea]|nr:hypothetical protein F4782DRAFT_547998 [Xylaria castorea]